MKKALSFLLSFVFVSSAWAKIPTDESTYHDVADWRHFDQFMQSAEEEDRKIGWSYIISGVLVAAGGTIGGNSAQDTGSKLMLGVATSLGIGATGYGAIRLLNGNDYSSFYESLRRSSLTPAQRDELVKFYVAREKDRQETERVAHLITSLVAGGLTLYSASRETDKNSKTFLQFLAGVNFAMALSYSF